MCTAGPLLAKRFVRLSNYKKSVLQESFAKNAYPKNATLHELSNQLGLSKSKVQRWFCNHRQRGGRNDKHQTPSKGEDFPSVHVY